jgi:hypothetical protein
MVTRSRGLWFQIDSLVGMGELSRRTRERMVRQDESDIDMRVEGQVTQAVKPALPLLTSMSAGDALIDMTHITPAIPVENILAVSETPTPAKSTPARKGILHLTVDVPAGSPGKDTHVSLPRWFTPEFYLYYVMAVVIIPLMVWVPWKFSSCTSAPLYLACGVEAYPVRSQQPRLPYIPVETLPRLAVWTSGGTFASPFVFRISSYVG